MFTPFGAASFALSITTRVVGRWLLRCSRPLRRAQVNARRTWRRVGTIPQVAASIGVCTCAVCALTDRAPYTDRWRFRALVSHDAVVAVGDLLFQSELQTARDEDLFSVLPDDHPAVVQARGVMERLLSAAAVAGIEKSSNSTEDCNSEPRKHRNWRLAVLDKPDVVYAATCPGGPIVLCSGLLRQSEERVAGVLAHEIAHVLQDHFVEQLSRLMLFVVVLQALAVSLDVFDFPPSHELGKIAYDYLAGLPLSRVCEAEADRVAVDILAAACYDPRPFGELLRELGDSEAAPVEDFRNTPILPALLDRYACTHPHINVRSREIIQAASSPEVMQRLAKCKCSRADKSGFL